MPIKNKYNPDKAMASKTSADNEGDIMITYSLDVYKKEFSENSLPNESSNFIEVQQLKQITDVLLNILSDCSKVGWDGYDAQPIDKKVITEGFNLLNIISSINKNILTPGLSPAPNGSIIFEWRSDDIMLTISVMGQERLIYTFINENKSIAKGENITNKLPAELENILLNYFQSA